MSRKTLILITFFLLLSIAATALLSSCRQKGQVKSESFKTQKETITKNILIPERYRRSLVEVLVERQMKNSCVKMQEETKKYQQLVTKLSTRVDEHNEKMQKKLRRRSKSKTISKKSKVSSSLWKAQLHVCPACHGTGIASCFCSNGKIECILCNEKGYIVDLSTGRAERKICPECGGSKIRTCPNCKGTGKIKCGRCGGTGKI